jgi:hypothetical protein
VLKGVLNLIEKMLLKGKGWVVFETVPLEMLELVRRDLHLDREVANGYGVEIEFLGLKVRVGELWLNNYNQDDCNEGDHW